MSADKVAEIEERRAARKAALAEQEAAQRAIDLEALDDAEVKHGDSNVYQHNVPYTPGMPTMCIARCPTPLETKRFQDRVKPRANGKSDPDAGIAAAKELTAVTLVYPDKDVFKTLCEQRPMVELELGVAALGLAKGAAADEGKG